MMVAFMKTLIFVGLWFFVNKNNLINQNNSSRYFKKQKKVIFKNYFKKQKKLSLKTIRLSNNFAQ